MTNADESGDIEENYNLNNDSKKQNDGRLFPEYLLYCEGLEKPTCRGWSHLFCACLLPFGMWHLVTESNGSTIGSIAAVVYISSNIWCYGFSALFHVGRWSVSTEIFLQKMDHCGIAILSCGVMLPVSLLLLSPVVGGLFAFLSVTTCCWACWNIVNLRPSVIRLIVVACVLVPFIPFCYYRMNELEFRTMLSTYIFQAIGLAVFLNKFPDPFPKHFGYHEVFHIFVIFAGVCVYLCNWSVIRRTCNPYMRNPDIVDIILPHLSRTFKLEWSRSTIIVDDANNR